MTKHNPLTPEELAEIDRLLAVANGTAPRQYWNGDDDTPLDIHKENLTPADAAYLDHVAKVAKELK